MRVSISVLKDVYSGAFVALIVMWALSIVKGWCQDCNFFASDLVELVN